MDITTGNRVTCCVCGLECDAGVKAISYLSAYRQWMCSDEHMRECRERAAARARTHNDEDFPIVCENGCPEGYLGRHKFSCDLFERGQDYAAAETTRSDWPPGPGTPGRTRRLTPGSCWTARWPTCGPR